MQFVDDQIVEKYVEVGSDHVFAVLGAHVMVFTLISSCHFIASIAWTSSILILVQVKYFMKFM